MEADTIIAIIGVTAIFLVFMGALYYGWRQAH